MTINLTEDEKREIENKIERQQQKHQREFEWGGYGISKERQEDQNGDLR